MEIDVKVLEYNSGVMEGSSWSNVLCRYNDKLVKFKINPKANVDLSKDDVDSDVTLTLEIVAGQNQSATPRIVSVTR